jgi:hypothetical protein
MTDSEMLAELRMILSAAGEWYNEHKADQDYVYDMAYEQFNELTRSDCQRILGILFENINQ